MGERVRKTTGAVNEMTKNNGETLNGSESILFNLINVNLLRLQFYW